MKTILSTSFVHLAAATACVAAVAMTTGCTAPTQDSASSVDALNEHVGATALPGSYDAAVSLGNDQGEFFKLRIDKNQTSAVIVGETGTATFPDNKVVPAQVVVSGANVKVSAANVVMTLTLASNGTLSGTFAANGATHPLTVTPVVRPDVVYLENESSRCTSLTSMLFGGDQAREAKYNDFFAKVVEAQCSGGKTLKSTARAFNGGFASVDVVQLDSLDAFGGKLLDHKSMTAAGVQFDPAASLVGTQANYDAIIEAFADENAFAFSGGEGSGGSDSRGAAKQWAQQNIKLVNGKIVADMTLSNGSFVMATSAISLTLDFAKVSAMIDPESPVGQYLASRH